MKLLTVNFYAGHIEGTRVVHLTARSFLVEAVCGEIVGFDGEPEIPVMCDECHSLAVAGGGDPSAWVVISDSVELRIAA